MTMWEEKTLSLSNLEINFSPVIFIVAKMHCNPKLFDYHKHVPKESSPYKAFDAGGIVFDKDGVPTDTTKNIVEAFHS